MKTFIQQHKCDSCVTIHLRTLTNVTEHGISPPSANRQGIPYFHGIERFITTLKRSH